MITQEQLTRSRKMLSQEFHQELAEDRKVPVFVFTMLTTILTTIPSEVTEAFATLFISGMNPEKVDTNIEHNFMREMLNHPQFGLAQQTTSPTSLKIAEMYNNPPGTYTEQEWNEATRAVNHDKAGRRWPGVYDRSMALWAARNEPEAAATHSKTKDKQAFWLWICEWLLTNTR